MPSPTPPASRPDPRGPTRPRLCLAALALFACKPDRPPEPHAPAPATAPATPTILAGPVVSIDLTGTLREREARAALITTTGAAYDLTTIASDVRALWRLGGLADIHVDARPVPGGVALRYRIDDLPPVRKVNIVGGPPLLTSPWRLRAANIKDVPQDPATLQRFTTELCDDLVDNAYLDAAVTWRAVPVGDGRVDIVVDIDTGPQVSLAALVLQGNRKLKTGELEATFRTHGFVVGQPFTTGRQNDALLAITARYLDLGHVLAEIRALPEARSPDRKTISLTFDIHEGDAFRLGKLTFAGALIAPVRDYERRITVRPRQTFVRSKVVADIEKIRAMHRERGASEPNVTTLTNLDPIKKTIDLTFELASP